MKLSKNNKINQLKSNPKKVHLRKVVGKKKKEDGKIKRRGKRRKRKRGKRRQKRKLKLRNSWKKRLRNLQIAIGKDI